MRRVRAPDGNGALCGVKLSAASVETLHKRTSDALEDPYAEVLAAVDESPVRGADETSFSQAGRTQWLSVATAQRAVLCQTAAKALLGETPRGVIISDRYALYLYLFIDDAQRQLSLAHVLGDFTALAERGGSPGRAWAASCSAN